MTSCRAVKGGLRPTFFSTQLLEIFSFTYLFFLSGLPKDSPREECESSIQTKSWIIPDLWITSPTQYEAEANKSIKRDLTKSDKITYFQQLRSNAVRNFRWVPSLSLVLLSDSETSAHCAVNQCSDCAECLRSAIALPVSIRSPVSLQRQETVINTFWVKNNIRGTVSHAWRIPRTPSGKAIAGSQGRGGKEKKGKEMEFPTNALHFKSISKGCPSSTVMSEVGKSCHC